MAKANKKHFGVGTQGKRAGGGSMTDKEIQTEQLQDHSGNRLKE